MVLKGENYGIGKEIPNLCVRRLKGFRRLARAGAEAAHPIITSFQDVCEEPFFAAKIQRLDSAMNTDENGLFKG